MNKKKKCKALKIIEKYKMYGRGMITVIYMMTTKN